MDIRSFFCGASSSKSPGHSSSSDTEDKIDSNQSDTEFLEPSPAKKRLIVHEKHAKERLTTHEKSKKITASSRKYNKKWEESFNWLMFDKNFQGAFCKVCRKRGISLQRTGGTWISKPFTNWKKAIEKMKIHAKSDIHLLSCEAEMAAATALQEGSVIQQLQQINDEEKLKNRMAIKALIRCTHFLARRHIPHTTNFDELIDLIVSCGAEDLKGFLERARLNATYTSKVAVVEFVEAVGLWAEECLLKRLRQASHFSIMADECTDVTTTEELSIFFRWVNMDGQPVEHFLDIVPLKATDAKTIYSALVEFMKDKNIQISKLVGMGFDGAATFSGKHNGVQSLLKKISPHALFVHCHCHLLQLACVQAANATSGIKHVYITLTTLWKFFHYSPKRAESLKAVQQVLDLPELKVVKPSDTRWLSHERCVKAVKASYSAIVTALNNIYEQTHAPEALGISKALCRPSTLVAIYLLDYVLPQVAKLSRALQTERIDLTAITPLVDATLNTLDDAMLPAANWVLELMDAKNEIEEVTDITLTTESIATFQGQVAEPFIRMLKANISSRFISQDIVSSFGIFDPKKVPAADSSDFHTYGEDLIDVLLAHYGAELPAKTAGGDEYTKEALISRETREEWKTFRSYLSKKPKGNLHLQLKELTTSDMLSEIFSKH